MIRKFGKYKFLTSEDVSPERRLLEKAATIKDLNIHHCVVSSKSKLTLKKTVSRIGQGL